MNKHKHIEKAAMWLSRAEECTSRKEALKCIRKYSKHQNKLEAQYETLEPDQSSTDPTAQ